MIYSVTRFFFSMWIVLENININSGRYITVYRHLWNAREETSALSRFHLPIKYFHASTCPTSACNTIESCSSIVLKMQVEHMTKNGWRDIAYNFLIDGLGRVYEGTGWYAQAVTSDKEFLSICLFGIEDYRMPPREFLDGLQNILQFGKDIGYLSQTAKPVLSLKKKSENMTDQFWQQQLDWERTILQNTYDLSSNEKKNQENNNESPETISHVDWSEVFPNHGNRTALNKVISHKQTIGKSNWNKVFKTQDEVTSIDWSSLLRHNSNNQINWSEIFNNDSDNFDVSKVNALFPSSRSRISSKLGRNNDW